MTSNRFATLCALCLIFFATEGIAQEGRLATDIVPIHQSIDLKIDPSGHVYSGSTRITLQAGAPVSSFRLHSDGIKIEDIRLGAGGQPVTLEHSIQNDLLSITPKQPLPAGRYSLVIDFSNEFNTQAVGLYRMESEGLGYAYTQFEANDARKAFPCFDEPAFKIPFQLTITAREDDAVVTNTPLGAESRGDGWKTLAFETTPPLPTYLVAIAAGPMDSVEIPDLSVPGRIYTPRGQSGLAAYAGAMVAPILQFQQAYFGMTYPYRKLDFIAIPEYWPGAMEHPGAITYLDRIILLDEQNVSASQKRRAARVIAHELAHQWFGNLVTLEWWDDLWLNEAFADWFGDKTTVELYPASGHDLAELGSVNGTMKIDSRPTSEPIRQPVVNPSDLLSNVGLAYNKGKSVIAMFERWIGPESFRQGVNAYLRKHAWGNAQATDFWAALGQAAGGDVATSMETFLVQPGVPLVEATIEPDGVRLTQKRFSNHGTDLAAQNWRIPVGLRIGSNGQVFEKTVLLAGEHMKVPLTTGAAIDWVLPNADGAGYYRWNIGEEGLRSIAPGAEKILTKRERVAFLGNLGALLDAGEIGGDSFLNALGSFAGDPEPFVVAAVIDELDRVNDTFVTADTTDAFARYLDRTLSPAADRFGLEPVPGESDTVAGFRPNLLYWLGRYAEDEAVLNWAATTVDRYRSAPGEVDPSLAGVALRITAKKGDESMYQDYLARFSAAENPAERANYLRSLGAFENAAIREQALAYTLAGPLRANEIFTIPGEIFSAPDGADRVFDWFVDHYADIASRLPPLFLPLLTGFGGGCDIDRLEAARAFFSRPDVRVDGTEKQMEKTAAQVMDCVNLRRREGDNVHRYLLATESQGG
jgi:alanyl aminopeptidase